MILDQLEQVRQSGLSNMYDRRGVQRAANDLELFELVVWIEDHSGKEYIDLLHGLIDYRKRS